MRTVIWEGEWRGGCSRFFCAPRKNHDFLTILTFIVIPPVFAFFRFQKGLRTYFLLLELFCVITVDCGLMTGWLQAASSDQKGTTRESKGIITPDPSKSRISPISKKGPNSIFIHDWFEPNSLKNMYYWWFHKTFFSVDSERVFLVSIGRNDQAHLHKKWDQKHHNEFQNHTIFRKHMDF